MSGTIIVSIIFLSLAAILGLSSWLSSKPYVPPAPATKSYAWLWWPVLIIILAGLIWFGYKHLQPQTATVPRTSTPKAHAPVVRKVFTPLILEATAYNKAASQGVKDSKETTPPEAFVKGGGEITFSFFVGTELPKDKSVLVKATLIPDTASPQTHLGDPVFSIGNSPDLKILLRGGPQEIILGCPARDLKKGKNFFSYKSRGMPFKISGNIRVYLSL